MFVFKKVQKLLLQNCISGLTLKRVYFLIEHKHKFVNYKFTGSY